MNATVVQDLSSSLEAYRSAVARRPQAPAPWQRRIVVLGLDAAEIVRAVGGWAFDQSIAGWDVLVPLLAPDDDRPLRILGATTDDCSEFVAAPPHANRTRVLVLDPEMCELDDEIECYVSSRMADPSVDVLFWNVGARYDWLPRPAQYRPSYAAKAFKQRALEAASGTTEGWDDMEHLAFAGRGPARSTWRPGVEPGLHSDVPEAPASA